MDKKIRRFVTTTIVCVLVASIFGSAMVLAPAPDLIFPQLIDVFVTNTSNDPVPVDVTDDTLDVTLDEPIDVTLDEPIDVTLDEPIEVTNPSGESLDVNVANTLDVSGWLHTTEWGKVSMEFPGGWLGIIFQVKTDGYRQIAIGINDVVGADFTFSLHWFVGNATGFWKIYSEPEFTVTAGTEDFLITSEVIGNILIFWGVDKTPGEPASYNVRYYLTT